MHVYPREQECLVISGQRRVIDPDTRLIKWALNNTLNTQLIQIEWCRACCHNLRQVDLHHSSRLPPCNCKPEICLPLGCEIPLQPLRQKRHARAAQTTL